MGSDTGPDPLSPAQRISVLRGHLEREKSRRREAEAKLAEVTAYCRDDCEVVNEGLRLTAIVRASDILAITGSDEKGNQ